MQRQRFHIKVLWVFKRAYNENIKTIVNNDTVNFSKANCYIYQSEIGNDNDINQWKFRDHYHYEDNYRKVAQNICSLK